MADHNLVRYSEEDQKKHLDQCLAYMREGDSLPTSIVLLNLDTPLHADTVNRWHEKYYGVPLPGRKPKKNPIHKPRGAKKNSIQQLTIPLESPPKKNGKEIEGIVIQLLKNVQQNINTMIDLLER